MYIPSPMDDAITQYKAFNSWGKYVSVRKASKLARKTLPKQTHTTGVAILGKPVEQLK